MDIHTLGDTWPDGVLCQTCAIVTNYDEQALTVKLPGGTQSDAIFAADGGVGVFSYRLEDNRLCQYWLWMKVGDLVLNEDGTQCYPILERHGSANVKAGAIAVYVSGE